MGRDSFDYDPDDYVSGFDVYEYEAECEGADLMLDTYSDKEGGTSDPYVELAKERAAEAAGKRPVSGSGGDADFFESAEGDYYDDQEGAEIVDFELPAEMTIPNQWALMEDHNVYYGPAHADYNREVRQAEYYADHGWQKYLRRKASYDRWRNPVMRDRLMMENRTRMKARYYGVGLPEDEAKMKHDEQKHRAKLRMRKSRAKRRAAREAEKRRQEGE